MTKTDRLTDEQIDPLIEKALEEDTAAGDITTAALIPDGLFGRASFLIKEAGILAGIGVAGRVFTRVDPSVEVTVLIEDGTPVKPGDIAATVVGNMAGILTAERTALNFLQRLSGIASMTAQYVAEVKGFNACIFDTRKTTPGLRVLEKYAVRMGGGCNHRMHLGDGILIKDNHLAALRATGMTLKDIIAKARQNTPAGTTVELEVTTPREALEAMKAGADIIMLDNMQVNEMKQVVNAVNERVQLEASGNVNLANVHHVAMTGVDRISIGSLTHSVRSLDISLEFESQTFKLL